ncbi:MAG: hypothetical protein HY817_01400 [Candidatus Abawacabacteria bacterium]|nr:hypothetical protein [Candidatus Abawacabacteria bacterium]
MLNNFARVKKAKRIAIIGISGSGKSTLARQLATILSLPLLHMDQFIWLPHWTEANIQDTEKALATALQKEQWILEGYIHPCAQLRLSKADIILYLDYSGIRAMYGGIKRWFKYRGQTRPEMPIGCNEKLSLKYLKVMLHRLERNEIEETLPAFHTKVIRLANPKQTKQLVAGLI